MVILRIILADPAYNAFTAITLFWPSPLEKCYSQVLAALYFFVLEAQNS